MFGDQFLAEPRNKFRKFLEPRIKFRKLLLVYFIRASNFETADDMKPLGP